MKELLPEFPTPIDESRSPFLDLTFLIVDDDPDGRFLVAKTLLRKFPKAAITECQDAEAAFLIFDRQLVSLIICHRTFEFDGIALIAEFRKRNASVPILMMSGIDRKNPALAAGADAFLTYEEWLMVGNHVAALLTKERAVIAEDSTSLATNRR